MKTVASFALAASASAVHPDRQAQIARIQSIPGVSWRAAPQARFADQAPGVSWLLAGLKEGWKAKLEASIAAGKVKRLLSSPLGAEIPESFDSEGNWPQCAEIIGDIRDQSNCGCCWAFAGAEAASDRMCIASNATLMMPLSAQDVCFCGSANGCGGGFIDEPWDYIKESGVVTGGQYQDSGPFGGGFCSAFSLPHCHHHGPQGDDPYPAEGAPGCPEASSPACPSQCDSSASTEHQTFGNDKYTFEGDTVSASGEAAIQQMLMAGGPAEVAFTVYSDFEDYAGGIYHHVTGDMAGGHAVKMVGWGVENGQKYWKVANSWNPYWGERGYFRIRRGSDECGIEGAAVASSPTAVWRRGAPPPTPAPPCVDAGTASFCESVVSQGYCSCAKGSNCWRSCGCCNDSSDAVV